MLKVPVPKDFSIFQSKSKLVNPITMFYDWLLNQAFPSLAVLYKEQDKLLINSIGKTVKITAVKMDKTYQAKLTDVYIEWLIKKNRCTRKHAEESATMTMFAYSPSFTNSDQDPEFIYIDDDVFGEKQ